MQSFKDVCDDELLCLMKHGSEKAFNALYKRYWEKILSIAINKLCMQLF